MSSEEVSFLLNLSSKLTNQLYYTSVTKQSVTLEFVLIRIFPKFVLRNVTSTPSKIFCELTQSVLTEKSYLEVAVRMNSCLEFLLDFLAV